MAVIAYKNYLFIEPAYVNADVYEYYKKALFSDVNFHIIANNESFTGKFKRKLLFLIIALPIAAILISIFFYFKDIPDLPIITFRILGVLGIILSVVCFFVLIILLMEGSSYAVYLNNKKQFFIGLEHAIKTSKNYSDFELLFYGGLKNAKNYKIRAKEATAINKPPTTVESTLIFMFRIIDGLLVVVGFIAIVWVIKHYFFDK